MPGFQYSKNFYSVRTFGLDGKSFVWWWSIRKNNSTNTQTKYAAVFVNSIYLVNRSNHAI